MPKENSLNAQKKSVKVVQAKWCDISEIGALIRGNVYSEFSQNSIKRWIINEGWPANRHVWWYVAVLKGRIVGAMRWAVWDRYYGDVILNSSWLAVDKRLWRKGVGTALWMESKAKVERTLNKRGEKVKMIFTQADLEEEAACRFYEKNFGRFGDVKRVVFDDVWSSSSTGKKGIAFYFVKVK